MKKILIVEDDEILRNNLYDILTNENYKVITAKNGDDGYKKAKNYLPDLIISDIMMPILDGYQLLEKIQQDTDLTSVPFIFLSAKSNIHDLRKGMNIGADDYIYKPFDIDELLTTVKTRIKKSDSINKKNEELKESLIRKIPHELRTPLVGIIGYTDILNENLEEYSLEELKNILNNIKFSGKRLNRRIEKFLLYSELLSDEIKNYNNENEIKLKTYFDNNYAVCCLLKLLEETNKRDLVTFDIQSVQLKIYDKYLDIILKELFENAAKFSPENEKIEFFGNYTIDGYKIGTRNKLKEEDKIISNKIELFKNLNQNNYEHEGVGLGLSIVKKITEDAGGELIIKINENNFYIASKLHIYGEIHE